MLVQREKKSKYFEMKRPTKRLTFANFMENRNKILPYFKQHDFGAKKQNTFSRQFDGSDSENDLRFLWLATVFAVLTLLIFLKKDQFTIFADRKI